MDVNSIPYGEDFPEHLRQTVGQCQVVVAVIGPTWLASIVERSHKEEIDWVRAELGIAQTQGIPIIPLRVNRALMPTEAELPEDLKPLASLNAAEARFDPDFHTDMNRLIAQLEKRVGDRNPVDLSNLSAQELKRLRQALISAFSPTRLALMVEEEGLAADFNLLTQGQSDYELTVWAVVKRAKSENWVRALLEGALRANPDNLQLKALAQMWL